MKVKLRFKVIFEYEKKNFIWVGAAMLLAFAMFLAVGYHPLALVLFGLLLFFIRSIRLELDERTPWLWTAIMFAVGAAFTVYSIQYLLLDAELFAKTSSHMLRMNILCVLLVYLFVQVFTNNSGLTCIIAHSGLLLLGFINYFVYMFRGNEFSFSDLRSIGTGLSVADNYRLRLEDRGAYVLLATTLFFALVCRCRVSFVHRLHMRIMAVMGAVLCGIIVAANVYNVNTETWEQKGSYRNGYILNYVLGIRDSFISAPEGYSAEAVAKLEETYKVKETSAPLTDREPTIIVIMNESFADLGVLGELRTNMPLTPFYDSLYENTTKGYALSSVFGAKTPNSEWEFMTGNSMAFLPEGSVVYQQYINSTPTSIVSGLKGRGYTCVAMHPYYASGWSRNQVYPDLGYDEMHFIEDFDQTKLIREYISDRELYEKVIERYENRKVNEKLYLMGITMQNHGGYTETHENFPENYYKIGRSYTDANQYFSLVHESDEALEYLISYFSEVDEPVEIVFFGDHQPSLNSSFYPILNGKGLSGLTEDELEKLYMVPFFIWTNYDTPEETVEITSLNYLSTLTLEKAGMELFPYNKFLSEMMEVVPALNSRGYYSRTQGRYLHLDEAAGEEAAWLRRYEQLQYNSMFDKKGRSDVFFPY